MSRIRVGIIGAGFGQYVHAPVFNTIPGSEVTSICASNSENNRKTALKLGLKAIHANWHELIDDDAIDAVSIAVPPFIQPEITLYALSAGKPVFCEKPLAPNLYSAQEIIRMIDGSKLANMINFEFPELPVWCEAKRRVQESIGMIHRVSISWNVETYANKHRTDSWKRDASRGGGTLHNLGSHVFHYIEWFFGPIRRLNAHLSVSPGDRAKGDVHASLMMELQSSTSVIASISAGAFLGGGHRIECYGENGSLVLENSTSDYIKGFKLFFGTRDTNSLEHIPCEALAAGEVDGRISAMKPLAERFIRWIHNGVPAKPNLHDGLRVQSLIQAAKSSHEKGEWINTGE